MLADDYKKQVMIVGTSNEIVGDGDIPHPGIGNAHRLQVPNQEMQHKVLVEAVENHMPQAIVIDEIGTRLEAMAASTIAQRGIQLVATAHGVTIENLTMNPCREMLVEGVQQEVTVQKEQFHRGPYEVAAQFEVDSLSNARTSLDSAFNLDSAEGHIERSNGSEAGFNLYAYGVFVWGC